MGLVLGLLGRRYRRPAERRRRRCDGGDAVGGPKEYHRPKGALCATEGEIPSARPKKPTVTTISARPETTSARRKEARLLLPQQQLLYSPPPKSSDCSYCCCLNLAVSASIYRSVKNGFLGTALEGIECVVFKDGLVNRLALIAADIDDTIRRPPRPVGRFGVSCTRRVRALCFRVGSVAFVEVDEWCTSIRASPRRYRRTRWKASQLER
jgi:hypothetical protein